MRVYSVYTVFGAELNIKSLNKHQFTIITKNKEYNVSKKFHDYEKENFEQKSRPKNTHICN